MNGKNRVVAVDPGVHNSGWSSFVEEDDGSWRLVEAGFIPSDLWISQPLKVWPYENLTLIIEKPEKYPTKNIYHDDLANLSAVVDMLEEYAREHSWQIEKVKPAAWKGQVPKKVHHLRITNELSQLELDSIWWPTASLSHNVLDAIGLGLYQVKRLGRGGKKLSTD